MHSLIKPTVALLAGVATGEGLWASLDWWLPETLHGFALMCAGIGLSLGIPFGWFLCAICAAVRRDRKKAAHPYVRTEGGSER